MAEKRYTIVMVNKVKLCPIYEGITGFCRNSGCDDCKMKENYGDTKEQLMLKIAQAIFKKINAFGGKWQNKIWTEADKRYSYKLAKQIVEFLGVK